MRQRLMGRTATMLMVGVGLGLVETACTQIKTGDGKATISPAKAIVPAPNAVGSPAATASAAYGDTLRSMIDLKRLAVPPAPGVTCRQFSSYDRKSRIDASGKRLDWGANADYGNYLRREGSAYVMADMKGPGCIVRIWSANPMGILKIYLDGNPEPVLAEDFLKLTTGQIKPFAEPIVGRRSQGANIYLPIPYQKHCKVVVDRAKQPKRMYYLVDYWTYKQDARVPTWSMGLLNENMETYKKVAAALSDPSSGPAGLGEPKREGASLRPGMNLSIIPPAGPAAIRALRIKVAADDLEPALREVALSIAFDGSTKAQVWAPVGDFFGTAPGINPYKGLPLGMTKDGWMYCYWYMPYNESAYIQLINEGRQVVKLDVQYAAEKIKSAKDLLTFHGGWRRSSPNTTFDWPFLECVGRGRYVGVAMFVFNPIKGWWGEGDEKVWVDDEPFPSWYGTGSEDYFGYAWCCNRPFFHAYHNQPRCDGPGNQNHSSVNRFHIIDNVPFQKSFRMTIENYAKDKDYSCTTYWYATAGSQDFFVPVPVGRRGVAKKVIAKALMRIKGAIEGESLKIVAKQTTGQCDRQDLEPFGPHWSGGNHMWFRPTGAGEWVDLELPVAKAGKYKFVIYGTKAIDYGIVQYSLNGKKLGKPIDAFNNGVVPTKRIELSEVELKAGKARLKMEVIGKNPKAVGYMAGLDCVVLEAAK